MPTRSYQCTNEKCEKREFELEDMSMNDKDSDVICPTCQSSVKRIFRAVPWSFTCQGSYNQTRGK